MVRFALTSVAGFLAVVGCQGKMVGGRSLTDEGYEYPEVRYTAWWALGFAHQQAAEALGYTEITWDNANATIEENSYDALSDTQKQNIEVLEMSETQWDCYVNHYTGYSWEELATYEVQQPFIDLGWTEASWNDEAEPPASEAMMWEELTEAQRAAAEEICLFEETWNEESIAEWGTTTPVMPETRYMPWSVLMLSYQQAAAALGYTEETWNGATATVEDDSYEVLTDAQKQNVMELEMTEGQWDCHVNHYEGYSWTELELYELDGPYVTLGWSAASWDDDTDTVAHPDSDTKMWAELTQAEQEAAAEVCYIEETWDELGLEAWNSVTPMRPEARYTVWSALGSAYQTAAQGLGYVEDTWNDLGSAVVESKSYETLSDAEKESVTALMMTEDQWDCFVNHYDDYDWAELDLEGVQPHIVALGWSESSWLGNADPPASEDKEWDALTADEKVAAEGLCFFKESWNDLSLLTFGTGSTGTFPPGGLSNVGAADFRYVAWDDLEAAKRTAAEELGYDETSWNKPGTADIEKKRFDSLTADEQDDAVAVGFNERTWDCHVNHYDEYGWAQLEEAQVQAHFVALGWTEATWVSNTEPASSDKDFDDLTADEKAAAEGICHTKLTWDEEVIGAVQNEDTEGKGESGAAASLSVAAAATTTTAIAAAGFVVLAGL